MPVLESTSGELRYTTSTVLSTRIATITACSSGGTDCSPQEKTSYTTTETILVTTTVCPITRSEATKTAPTETSDIGLGGDRDDYTTSTIFSTRTATVTACPSTLPDCFNQQKSSYTMIETLVISTTVYPVTGAEATRSVETSITEPHFVPVPGSTTTSLVSSPGSELGKSFISGSGHNASEAHQTSGLDFTKSTMSGVNSQTAVREIAPVGTSQKPIPTLVVPIAPPARSDSTTIQDEYASSISHPATSSSSLYQSKATPLVKTSSAPPVHE
ncbi:hypothetical protein N7528_009190 [Penicillium herquei]|nr:hypothetical protein N7528_009190 [Penicillium herquei]